ncbi:MAG: tRNA (adenosine(37)-N6)-dimethylallyltransferase MiaA [Deltaproteobacteria bacterium]|nr:tRNA (adenosine(37)-N6)-dimethylallyltransferase MiaA [Deltaproteobacteria bacterium]
MNRPALICIVGPTASGKSAVAVELAKSLDAEVVSADSMQVYRYLDIGTAKPSPPEMKHVPHHMIDAVNPDEDFTVSDYREMAAGIIDDIHKRGKRVIIAGGTGLYVRALIKGLVDTPEADKRLREELEEAAEKKGPLSLYRKLEEIDAEAARGIHPNNRVRVIRALEVAMLSGRKISDFQRSHRFSEKAYPFLMLGIDVERDELYRRIESRVETMVENGFEREVRRLLDRGYSRDLKPMRAVGYKEMCAHIIDGVPFERTVELIKRDSRRYAKRQLTWFRKEEVQWLKREAFAAEELRERLLSFVMHPEEWRESLLI